MWIWGNPEANAFNSLNPLAIWLLPKSYIAVSFFSNHRYLHSRIAYLNRLRISCIHSHPFSVSRLFLSAVGFSETALNFMFTEWLRGDSHHFPLRLLFCAVSELPFCPSFLFRIVLTYLPTLVVCSEHVCSC